MKRNLRRIGRLISIFFPRNIYKILVKIYSMTNEFSGTRTQMLIDIIIAKKFNSYLEIGVWQGDNLLPIAKKFPGLTCYGVDPYSGSSFEEYYKKDIQAIVDTEYYEKLYLDIVTKAKNLQNINIIRKTSEEAAKDFSDESLDIVFIDARHDYDSVVKDIKLWLPKIKVGGILSGHNYGLSYFGVIEAVNNLIGYDNISIKSDETWFYIKR